VSIGLDTSVVLRLLVGAPTEQARAARERLERAHLEGETVIVTDLVLSECYFALHHHYGLPKARARELLAAMARSGTVSLSPPEALAALDPAAGAGVMDRLIHARHQTEGATTLTFDRKMAALEGARRLGP
jgi:predicted nucleic acid-binding protein